MTEVEDVIISTNISRQFENHVAKYAVLKAPSGADLELLDWRDKNGSSICFIRYVMLQGVLSISGDFGEAIHGWSWSKEYPWGLKNVAGCDIGYYMSKCSASSEGSRGMTWNNREAKRRFKKYIEENEIDLKDSVLNPLECIDDPLDSKDVWHFFLHEHGYDLFGEDYGELGEIGLEVNGRHIGHLFGLKMAMKQLQI